MDAIKTRWGLPRVQSLLKALFLELNLERARRFERPTPTLARLCSTPELRPLWPRTEPVWAGPAGRRAFKQRPAPLASGSRPQRPSLGAFRRRLFRWSIGPPAPPASSGISPLK